MSDSLQDPANLVKSNTNTSCQQINLQQKSENSRSCSC